MYPTCVSSKFYKFILHRNDGQVNINPASYIWSQAEDFVMLMMMTMRMRR